MNSAHENDRLLACRGLTRWHGSGCPACLEETGPERNTNVCPRCGTVVALAQASLDLRRGEVVGIIGESGSGKSTLVKMLYFDEEPSAGKAIFHGPEGVCELFELNAAQARKLRNRYLGIVYQNPHLGLNYRHSAGGNIAERLLLAGVSHYAEIRERARVLLRRTEVPEDRMDELPGRFSIGMQQRVQIAKALAPGPPLLLLDEVTTGLDVSVQARILDLILELQHELNIAMLVVTHDLGVVRLLAGRTLVLRLGRIVEAGLTDQILEDPQHPYTQQLISSAL